MPEECGKQERQQLAPGTARRRCQIAALPITSMAGRKDQNRQKLDGQRRFPPSEFDHGTALKG